MNKNLHRTEDGLCAEWWDKSGRKLTVYFDADNQEIQVLRSTGNIIEHRIIKSLDQLILNLKWINN